MIVQTHTADTAACRAGQPLVCLAGAVAQSNWFSEEVRSANLLLVILRLGRSTFSHMNDQL